MVCLMCTHILMHEIAHRDCTNTIRVFIYMNVNKLCSKHKTKSLHRKLTLGEKSLPHWGLPPPSVLWLAFQGATNTVRLRVLIYMNANKLCSKHKRVCAGSWLGEKNPLPHWDSHLHQYHASSSISIVTGFSGSLYALTYPCPSMCKNMHENAQH